MFFCIHIPRRCVSNLPDRMRTNSATEEYTERTRRHLFPVDKPIPPNGRHSDKFFEKKIGD